MADVTAPGLDAAYSQRLQRKDDADWQALLNSAPAPVENTPPAAENTAGSSAKPAANAGPKPAGPVTEGAGAVVTGAAVAGQALYAGGKAALTDPLGFLKAVGEGAWDGSVAAANTAVPGAQKLLGGLWSQIAGPGPAGLEKRLHGEADIVEGLFEVASSPFVGLGTWAQSAYEKLSPGERERVVLPGGRGSAPSAIRRLFNAPAAIAEAVRSGNLNPSPEQEAALDAPMTAGELLNIVVAVNGPKALSLARRAIGANALEGALGKQADTAIAKAGEASAKAEGSAQRLEGLVKELTSDRHPWVDGVKAVVSEAGAEFVKVTAAAGERTVTFKDPVTDQTHEMPVTELSKHNVQQAMGDARVAEAGGPEAVKKPITPVEETAPATAAQAKGFVEKAGGDFVGYTEMQGEQYVWFNDKTYGTTMLLKAEDATVSGITKHIAEKQAEFKAAREALSTEALTKLGVEPGKAAEIAGRISEQKPLTPSLESPYQPNYNYIQAGPEVKQMMRRVYETITERIAVKREGVATHDKVDAEAHRLLSSGDVTVEKLLDSAPSTEPVAGAKLRAYRMLEVGAAEHASEVKNRTLAGTAQPGELRKAIALSMEVSERVSLAKTGVARALESLKDSVDAAPGRITPEALARVADGIDPRLSDMELAQVFHVAEQVGGTKTTGRLMRYIQSFPDTFMEGFYGSVLWGKAIGRNFVGNLAMEPFPDVLHAMAGYMPKGMPFITPKEARLRPGVVPGEALARIQGHIEGWQKNLIAKSRLAALEEAGQGKFRLLHEEQKPAITAQNMGLEGLPVISAAVDYLGSGLRGSTAILEKNDVWTKSHVINADIYAMAHRRATVEGLSGEAFRSRYLDLIDDPTKFPKSDRAEIARRVKQDTYTMEVENPVARAFVEAMDRAPVSSAAIRFLVIAFPKITSNMFETFASYTPGLNVLSTRFWTEMRAGGARAQLAYSRLALGTAIYGTMLYWADEGVITGDLPTDPVLRAQAQKREDYQERSLNLGGLKVSYRGLGFLEDVLASAANFRHAIVNIPSPDMSKVTLALGLSMWDSVDNMAFINTFGQFASILGPVKSPEKRVEEFQKFLTQKTLSLVPFSGLQKEVRRAIDPVQRETQTFMQKFLDQTPGLSTLKDKDGNFLVPPKRDMLTGEPSVMWNVPIVPGNSKIDKQSPVWEEVWRMGGAGLRPVPDFITPGIDDDKAFGLSPNVLAKTAVTLTPQEKDRWVELMTQVIKQGGQTLHEKMAATITSDRYNRRSDRSDATKASVLQNMFTGYREAAKGLLIKESPALQKEMMRARAEDGIKKLPDERQPAARQSLRSRIGIAP